MNYTGFDYNTGAPIWYSFYDGDWAGAHNKSGFGVEIFAFGEVYSGQYFDNQMHGTGKMEYADGTTYEGEKSRAALLGDFQTVLAHLILSNFFEGDFYESVSQGNGKFTDAEGTEYVGTYVSGLATGIHTKTTVDGEVSRVKAEPREWYGWDWINID